MQRIRQTETFTQKQRCCSPFCFDPNILGVHQAQLCSVNQSVRVSPDHIQQSQRDLNVERGDIWDETKRFFAGSEPVWSDCSNQSACILMVSPAISQSPANLHFQRYSTFLTSISHTKSNLSASQLKKSTLNNTGRGVRNCASILLSECVVKSSSDYYCTTKTSMFLVIKTVVLHILHHCATCVPLCSLVQVCMVSGDQAAKLSVGLFG